MKKILIITLLILFVTILILHLSSRSKVLGMCNDSDNFSPEQISSIEQRITAIQKSTEPYSLIKFSESELNYILSKVRDDDSLKKLCIRLENDSKINLFWVKNDIIWSRMELDIVAEKPYLRASSIYFNLYKANKKIVDSVNQTFENSYESMFGTSSSYTRVLKKLEIREKTLYVYSSFDKNITN